MFNAESIVPSPFDSSAEALAKAVRFNSALLGRNGVVKVTGTSRVTPSLGQSAFVALLATSATVIDTIESVDTVSGAFTVATGTTLAQGEWLYGFFTSVKLTSGTVTLYPAAKVLEAPAVPALSASLASNGHVTLVVSPATGGAAPESGLILKNTNSGGYASLSAISPVGGAATYVDNVGAAPGDTVKYKAQYAEAYSSGAKLGRSGDFSNEVTLYRNSNDATLSALALSSGTLSPAFGAGTHAYTASIINAVASITATATKAQAGASLQVRVNGGSFVALTSAVASGALAMNVGANTVDVKVTAQDGTTTVTYTVTVTRAA